jgi:RNA polymerase sigma factor (sigma-70 family)
MEDQILWESFLSGDKTSFEQIYANYYQKLYSYGIRKIDQPDLVRDCIQDLFIYLWTNREKLGSTDNIKYYLIASLRNSLIHAGSSQSKWEKVELSIADDFHIQFNPESELIEREGLTQRSKMIVEALDQLTPRQKEVLYLRFFEEMEYDQIADLLNLTVKGVYKLNYRAIDALKVVLNISKTDLLILLAACKLELFR